MKFLDQAKIYIASGNGGEAALVFVGKNILSLVALMGVMEAKVEILFLKWMII